MDGIGMLEYREIEPLARELLDDDQYQAAIYEPIYRSRAQFFVRGFDGFSLRAKGLETNLNTFLTGRSDLRPSKGSMASALNGRPMTLLAACRLRQVLDLVADNKEPATEVFRAVFTPPGSATPLSLRPASVVPSVYHIDRATLEEARFRSSLKRIEAAQKVMGSRYQKNQHAHLFAHLEDGNRISPGTTGEYRITRYLAERIFHALRPGFEQISRLEDPSWDTVFTTSPTAGAKRGDNTIALPVANGNLLDGFDNSTSDQIGRAV